MLKLIPTTFTLQRPNRRGGIEPALALPIRLVPYATGDIVSAMVLVKLLAEADSPLSAYVIPIDKSHPRELPPKHWTVRHAQHISKGDAPSDIELPAGVFVWLDSLDYVYDFYFTPDRREPGWTPGERALMTISKEIWVEETSIPTLLEGFENFFECLTPTPPTGTEKHQGHQGSASQTGTTKRWTDTAKQELAAYRERHGSKAAAEKFGISGQRLRELLPKEGKPKKAGFLPFLKP